MAVPWASRAIARLLFFVWRRDDDARILTVIDTGACARACVCLASWFVPPRLSVSVSVGSSVWARVRSYIRANELVYARTCESMKVLVPGGQSGMHV